MTARKSHAKKVLCKLHRQEQYEKALDMLIRHECSPEYPHERFEKLKEVK